MLKKQNLLMRFAASYLIISTLAFDGFGQGVGNSPYSAIGIGEVVQSGYATNHSMGGSGVSFANGISINSLNPALLAKNHFTVFDVGLVGNIKTVQTATQSQKAFGMNLNYLALAFPIRPKYTMGVSFQPYTAIDNESRYSKAITGSVTDSAQYTYKSVGGVSRLAWTHGVQLGKSLYVGLEANYFFGSTERDTTTQLRLNDGQDYYLRYTNNTSYNGVGLKGGIAYQQKLNKKWQLNIGATYELQSTLKGNGLRSFSTLVASQNGPTLLKTPDTLAISRGKITLPDRYTIGISLESPFKWCFTADYSVQSWSKFRNFSGQADPNYTDSQTWSVGAEYLPNGTSTKYFNQVFYRIGFRSSQTPFTVYGTQISDQHLSLGTSLPLGRNSLKYANISVIFGKRGTILNNLVQENYTRIVVGFTINEAWFQKIRID
jgi:hypothetical protein